MGADQAFKLGLTDGNAEIVRCDCGCSGLGLREVLGVEVTIFGVLEVTGVTRIDPETEAAFLAGRALRRSAQAAAQPGEAQDHA